MGLRRRSSRKKQTRGKGEDEVKPSLFRALAGLLGLSWVFIGFTLEASPTGYSIYHAGTLSVRKPFAQPYTILANYTYSKSIDISTDIQLTDTPIRCTGLPIFSDRCRENTGMVSVAPQIALLVHRISLPQQDRSSLLCG